MFTETLTLSDGSANHAYGVVSTGDYKRIRKTPIVDALDNDELLTISHETDTKRGITRSKIGFDSDVEDAAGNEGKIRIYTVYEIPTNVALLADVTKVANQHRALLATSGFDGKIAGKEI